MICGVPESKAFMSCGFRAPVSVRSDGLPRREASCGFAGLTPGARPTVRLSEGWVVDRPGAGPPLLFGPFTCDPGTAEDPAPPGWDWDAAFDPVVPADGVAPLFAPPALPLLWARARPPD